MSEPLFAQGRVTILGVLNTTPDSFSDGGRFVRAGDDTLHLDDAVRAGLALAHDGADVLDVGGESTRPGARAVPVEREIARTAPLIAALAKRTDVAISIDTRKAAVAEAALDAGARIVNDVSGLRFDPALAGVVARHRAWLVLGHLRGVPESMQQGIAFGDVLEEVAGELAACVRDAREAGVADDRIVVDPGLGFGKHAEQSARLLACVDVLRARLGRPILLGPSRKSFLGAITGDPPGARDVATVAACAVAVYAGADALRVHDVAGARRAASVGLALRAARAHAGGRA